MLKIDRLIHTLHAYFETERAVNTLGYDLTGKNRLDDAIEIFKLNVEAYPRSANVYDSLAEAYFEKRQQGTRD